MRDALKTWLVTQGISAEIEQDIPEWGRADEGAVLDVVYRDGAAGRVCIDVSITDGAQIARQGRPWRFVLERRERLKHTRYPGPGLRPFVVDVGGRWGREAVAWLRQVVRKLPEEDRSQAAQSCRSAVAMALQSQCAEQVCSAHSARGA